MNEVVVIDLARQGLMVGLMVTAPILAVALFVGLVISILQAMTQVQEITLTYVPKMVLAAVVVLMFGSWMLGSLVEYTLVCFEQVARVTR